MGRVKNIPKKLAVKRQLTGGKAPRSMVKKMAEDLKASGDVVKPTKRKYRNKNKQIREILAEQENVKFAIQRAPFKRLVREIIADNTPTQMLVQPEAFDVLQYAAESYLAGIFKNTQVIAVNRKTITPSRGDMRTAMYISAPTTENVPKTLLQFDEAKYANRKKTGDPAPTAAVVDAVVSDDDDESQDEDFSEVDE